MVKIFSFMYKKKKLKDDKNIKILIFILYKFDKKYKIKLLFRNIL
jgi:hypothetical protein